MKLNRGHSKEGPGSSYVAGCTTLGTQFKSVLVSPLVDDDSCLLAVVVDIALVKGLTICLKHSRFHVI